MVQSMPQEEHEFGDGTFGGTVIAADDTCLEKLQTGFVTSHLDGATLALGDVDDDNATFAGFFQLADEPFFLGALPEPKVLRTTAFRPGTWSTELMMLSWMPGKRVSTTTLVSKR